MSLSYHANQFESGYNSTRVKNWEITKDPTLTSRIPESHEGSTQFLADNKGYLLPKAPRSEKTPWGTFMGTWELPAKLPPADFNPTARRPEAAEKLRNLVEHSAIRKSNISRLPDSYRPIKTCIDVPQTTTFRSRCESLKRREESLGLNSAPQPPPQPLSPAPLLPHAREREEDGGSRNREREVDQDDSNPCPDPPQTPMSASLNKT